MARVSLMRAWLTTALLVCSAAAAAQTAAAPLQPLARSALLAVEAGPVAGGLALRVQHSAEHTPLAVSDVAVSIDGKTAPASARADGSWFVPRPAGANDAAKTIEVTVGHDGIHEVLSGRLAPAAAARAAGGSSTLASSTHSQLAWWVLNIAVVLVAAIAISRRMS